MKPIKVMLVDDHAVVRMGFRLLLQATPDMEVVAEACSGEEVCQHAQATQADVVVMDLAMPGMGGMEAIKRMRTKFEHLAILALSAHEDISHPTRALQAGARGYLSKRSAPETLIAAIRVVAQGQHYMDAHIAQRMAMQSIRGHDSPVDQLSAREFEVFVQLARGQSVAQISASLTLSASTVGTHLYNIKQKLGLNNQAEMTLLAVRQGVIQVSD